MKIVDLYKGMEVPGMVLRKSEIMGIKLAKHKWTEHMLNILNNDGKLIVRTKCGDWEVVDGDLIRKD